MNASEGSSLLDLPKELKLLISEYIPTIYLIPNLFLICHALLDLLNDRWKWKPWLETYKELHFGGWGPQNTLAKVSLPFSLSIEEVFNLTAFSSPKAPWTQGDIIGVALDFRTACSRFYSFKKNEKAVECIPHASYREATLGRGSAV
ncbi:hypothetical protein QOT17_021237 [Balamuthia mandrillaris]